MGSRMGFLFPNPLALCGLYPTRWPAENRAAGGFLGQTEELPKPDCGRTRAAGDEDNDRTATDNAAKSWDTVKTTWKYSTGNSSRRRFSSQAARCPAWHFGQCRSPQELYKGTSRSQCLQRYRCPPITGVRQTASAASTLRWVGVIGKPFSSNALQREN